MLERFTLDPLAMVELHPHDHGVSPGHSGVDGDKVTLMSRSLTMSSVRLRELLRGFYDFVYGQAEVFVESLVGCGCSEPMQAQGNSIRSDPSLP